VEVRSMAAVKLTDGNDLWPGTGDNSRDDAVLGDRGDDTLYQPVEEVCSLSPAVQAAWR